MSNSYEQLSRVRTKVIDSVLQEGLKSQDLLTKEGKFFIGSQDTPGQGGICFAVFSGKGKILERQRALRDGLYTGVEAVFTSVAERPSGHWVDLKDVEYRARLMANFLVIMRADRVRELQRAGQVDHLPVDLFTQVVFPFPIWQDYPCPGMIDRFNYHVSPRLVLRRIGLGNHKAKLPNYETYIRDLIERTNATYLAHAVRLPTINDLDRFPYLLDLIN